jgi:hypothetical protein
MEAIIWAATALAITATISLAALRAWRGWLDLKHFEAARERRDGLDAMPAGRIDMANLKERIRKLEAIAQGVDL